jgi:hypothetical protein
MGKSRFAIAIAIGIAIGEPLAVSMTFNGDSDRDPGSDYSCSSNHSFNRLRPSSIETFAS